MTMPAKDIVGQRVRLLPKSVLFLALIRLLAVPAGGAESTLSNPTDRPYERALVRLKTPVPPEPFVVKSGGNEIAYQIEDLADRKWIWVCVDFAAGESKKFAVMAGSPGKTPPRVTVRREDNIYLLDNGTTAVRLPAVMGTGLPGPILGIRLPDGSWVGRSVWKTALKPTGFRATVVGDGTLFGKIRLRYEFAGQAGAAGDVPAFAEIDVKLGPDWRHVEIAERHEMPVGDSWEFAAADGWSPREGRGVPFSGGPGSGSVTSVPPPERPLQPGKLPYQRPDLFINLLPRWNQHFKDGWFFAATDGKSAVGVMPVLAGQWIWPHDNALEIVVNETGADAGVRCPVRRGARLWWLVAGESESVAGRANIDYFHRYAFENLDKINQDFILGWEGKGGGWFRINPYAGAQINPTDVMRRIRKGLLPKVGQEGNLTTLYQAQVYFHPDTYGTYWNYWSPENPNFFTDYIHVPVLLTTQLKKHPRFEELRRLAEMRVHEDVQHAFTLPGGAGQECPGYMAGAWDDPEGICRTHLGFDPLKWERQLARRYFKKRISQPDGAVRRTLPMGDTHPGPDGPKEEVVPADEVAQYATEELPGFGVIFNHRPGTPQESYLAFKAGPNRGHYHGDQLSVVANFNATPTVVDHHCSYHPRAGQEHMHNRVAFFTDQNPYLNLDGYERLIALKTSPVADVAIGQVESDRLREVNSQPPEIWDQRWPLVPLNTPLLYRRTTVFLKGDNRDAVVLRDQYRSPMEIGSAFCLHVRDEGDMAFQSSSAGGVSAGTAVFTDPAQDFGKLGAQPGWILDVGSRIKGRQSPFTTRYEVREVNGSRLSTDRPVSAGTNLLYTLYRNNLTRQGNVVTAGGVSVICTAPKDFHLRSFPWRHENGKPESTQGIRLETRGKTGEFVTVLVPGKADGVEAIDGGVKVDGIEVLFGGGLDSPAADAVVTVRQAGQTVVTVRSADINLDRSQGDIGLFVPDAGYPFGEIPDWLIRQRAKPPAWYTDYLKAQRAQ
jgi:hypothetical protein